MKNNSYSKYFNPALVFFLACIIFSSCEKPALESGSHMAFDKVDYISAFPENFILNVKESPKTNNVGLSGLTIFEDLLILGTTNSNGLWSIYSLPSYEYLGRFIKRGEGPLEFMQGPSANSKNRLTKENDQVIAYLYDFQKGRMMKFNVSESIASKSLQMSELDFALPPFLFDCILIDESSYLMKAVDGSERQQLRSIHSMGNMLASHPIEYLNEASINGGEDVNILSAITKFSESRNIFVEMPLGLNNLNIFSLDGSFSKTLCIGETLSDIDLVQKQEAGDRKYMFADLRLFDDFFGVVQIDEDIKTYYTERKKTPAILLFNWDGEPLAKIQLESHITSFDIDLINMKLYTFDVHTDEFFKYDISEILPKLRT